jgi:hypothetical protein
MRSRPVDVFVWKDPDVSAREFVNSYNTVGWVVGKLRKPMKDWKSAVHTWENRKRERIQTTGTQLQSEDVATYIIEESKRTDFDNFTGPDADKFAIKFVEWWELKGGKNRNKDWKAMVDLIKFDKGGFASA